MKINLPPDQYYASLAKVPTSGGVIIRNPEGKILITKNPYKNSWGIPGGMTESEELPSQSAKREVFEEIGLNIDKFRLFCTDFVIGNPWSRILFIFDCGIIDNETISKIKIDTDEVSEFKFVNYDEAMETLSPKLSKRLKNSKEALYNNSVIYLENSEKI